MSLTVEVLAEATLAEVGPVTANDSARTSFTLLSGQRLLALDASLNVRAEWPAGARHGAHHATDPARGLALISASDEVRLLDREGRVRWRHAHEEWTGDFESGCAWFDRARAFPALDIIGSFDPPEDHGWDFTACFAGDLIIAKLIGYVADNERLVAIDAAGTQHDLGKSDGWLLPAADGTWLSITPATIRRCRAIPA